MQIERSRLDAALRIAATVKPHSKDEHEALLSTHDDGRLCVRVRGEQEVRLLVESDGGEALKATQYPIAELRKAIAALPDGVVFLTQSKGQFLLLTHESDLARAEVHGFEGNASMFEGPASLYRAVTDGGSAVDAGDLAALLDRTSYCASTDESRPALTQTLVTADGAAMDAVATDGHRLAYARRPCIGDAVTFGVPAQTAKLLQSIITHAGADTVRVCVDGGGRMAQFAAGDAVVWIRQIDCTFPHWRSVVPDAAGRHRMTVDRDALLDAARAAGGMVDTRAPILRISIAEASVRVHGGHDGHAVQRHVGCSATADAEIGLNARYLADALGRLSPGDCVIRYSDALSAVTISRDDSEDFSLIMPMRQ